MKFYLKNNVFDEALERIRYIYDEFPNVLVGFSGGKDSTVLLNLTLQVAAEKGRLPLKVLFIDQEAEWQCVIDYIKTMMYDTRVEPWWMQIPIKLFNATSTTDEWLQCWQEGAEWMRDKDPISKKINNYGTDRFAELFTRIAEVEWPDTKTAELGGVRCEESPARAMGLTYKSTYKHLTYGKILNKEKEHFTFYPLYDWSYTDIWKAIHDNSWKYCKIYDAMYQHGLPVGQMRVSNVHHETSIHTLFYLQEIEAETWNKLTKRIAGINTAGQMKNDSFTIRELPYMFYSWKEYRDYLLENLITNPEHNKSFKHKFDYLDKKYTGALIIEDMNKMCINAMLCNDYHMTKIDNWERKPEVNGWRKFQKGVVHRANFRNKYLQS